MRIEAHVFKLKLAIMKLSSFSIQRIIFLRVDFAEFGSMTLYDSNVDSLVWLPLGELVAEIPAWQRPKCQLRQELNTYLISGSDLPQL